MLIFHCENKCPEYQIILPYFSSIFSSQFSLICSLFSKLGSGKIWKTKLALKGGEKEGWGRVVIEKELKCIEVTLLNLKEKTNCFSLHKTYLYINLDTITS